MTNAARTCCCSPTPQVCENVLDCADCQNLHGSPTAVALAVTGFSLTYETCSGLFPCEAVTCSMTSLAVSGIPCVDVGQVPDVRMGYVGQAYVDHAGCDGAPLLSQLLVTVSAICSDGRWLLTVGLLWACQTNPAACLESEFAWQGGSTWRFSRVMAPGEVCLPTAGETWGFDSASNNWPYAPGEEPQPCNLCGAAFVDQGAAAFLT